MISAQQIKSRLHRKLPPPTPHSVWTNPIHYITCVFGIGCFPIMPGTLATLAAVALCYLIHGLSITHYILFILCLNLLGVWLCGKTNKDFGSQDHPATCFDELATFPICLIGIPFQWPYILTAFILFRILDIIKPPPINYIDNNMHGGLGVMLDDIVAAGVTLGIMHLILVVVG
jgi:phosphatidylglycerophosphatase A